MSDNREIDQSQNDRQPRRGGSKQHNKNKDFYTRAIDIAQDAPIDVDPDGPNIRP